MSTNLKIIDIISDTVEKSVGVNICRISKFRAKFIKNLQAKKNNLRFLNGIIANYNSQLVSISDLNHVIRASL